VQASFVGAMAIADLVKSTLGPKGMVRADGGAEGVWGVAVGILKRRRGVPAASRHLPPHPPPPAAAAAHPPTLPPACRPWAPTLPPPLPLLQDKILQSLSRGREVSVTNDGATILKSVYVDNPAAKVLVDISKTQDDEVGAGWVGGWGGW
jgi:hypothetical protein